MGYQILRGKRTLADGRGSIGSLHNANVNIGEKSGNLLCDVMLLRLYLRLGVIVI